LASACELFDRAGASRTVCTSVVNGGFTNDSALLVLFVPNGSTVEPHVFTLATGTEVVLPALPHDPAIWWVGWTVLRMIPG
jgi:hypothetical protein